MRTSSAPSSESRPGFGRAALRTLAAGFAVLVLTLGLAVAPPNAPARAAETNPDQDARAESPRDAGAFLQELGEKAVVDLTDEEISEEERESRFRKLFTEVFDVESISRFILGANWRRADDNQRKDFLQVFEDAVVQRFLPMFAAYSGETFSIGRERPAEGKSGHIFVPVVINLNEGEPIHLEWRLKENDSAFKIVDVHAEGVSLAITLRQEYGAFVKRQGMDELIKHLRKKVAMGAFAPRIGEQDGAAQ